MRTLKKDIKHILDLQDAIDYMESKIRTAGSKAGEIIERNKILAEIQLMKKEEELKCKIQAIGQPTSQTTLQENYSKENQK